MPSSRTASVTTTVLPSGRLARMLPADPTTRAVCTPRTNAPSSTRVAVGAPAGSRTTAIGHPSSGVFPIAVPPTTAVPS